MAFGFIAVIASDEGKLVVLLWTASYAVLDLRSLTPSTLWAQLRVWMYSFGAHSGVALSF